MNCNQESNNCETISSQCLAQLTETMVMDIPELSQLREDVRQRYMRFHDFASLIRADPSTAVTPSAVIIESLEELITGHEDQSALWKKAFVSCLKVLSTKSIVHSSTDQAIARSKKRKTDISAKAHLRPDVSGNQVTPKNSVFESIPCEEDFSILAAYLKSTDFLFSVPSQRHITCQRPSCNFCREMFLNTNITRCDAYNHQNCTKSSFFPHIGLKLWKILKNKHDNGIAYCRLPSSSKVARYTLADHLETKSIITTPLVPHLTSAGSNNSPGLTDADQTGASPVYVPDSPGYIIEAENNDDQI